MPPLGPLMARVEGEWHLTPLMRWWQWGHRRPALAAALEPLAASPRAGPALARALDAVQALSAARLRLLIPPAAAAPAAAAAAVAGSGPGRRRFQEDDLWQGEEECGFLRVRLDGRTQRRAPAAPPACNARMASLLLGRPPGSGVAGGLSIQEQLEGGLARFEVRLRDAAQARSRVA